MDPIAIGLAVTGLIVTAAGSYYTYLSYRKRNRDSIDLLSHEEEATVPHSELAGPSILSNVRPKPGRQSVLDEVLKEKRLRVGCLSYPPFIDFVIRGTDTIGQGLYATMLEHLASEADLELEYSPLRWDNAISAITTRQVDLAVCVLQSRERRNSCDFAGTLYRVGVGGVMRQGQRKIRRHEDLQKQKVTIAVTKGEIGWDYAMTYLSLEKEFFRFTVVEHTRITQMMNLVSTGEVDIALADSLSCAQFVRQSGGALCDVFSRRPLHVEENSVMIPKNEIDFKVWLTKGFRSARMLPDVEQHEKAILREYKDILFRVDIV